MSLNGQTVAVHIVSFVNKNGFVPGKKQIDHLCNNRMCVNPDHLEMVSHKENQRRRDARKQEKANAKIPTLHRLLFSDEPVPEFVQASLCEGHRRVP